jgi:tetratricopeptide (TPR) repeat protein
VLLALGVDSMIHALGSWTRLLDVRGAKAGAYVFAVALVAGFTTIHGLHTKQVAEKPDARPQGVRHRVRFVESVRKKLFVDDEKWKDLDVDMGAHIYWSDFAMLDIAGLVDVPMGHHKFERAFIREYLFEEQKPQFAHVHGAWASTSKIPSHPEWRRDYVEIPGFPVGGGNLHIGNYVRKDLLLVDASPFDADQRRLGPKGLVFEGFAIAGEPGKARAMFVEVGVRKLRSSKAGNVRLLMAVKGPGGFDTFDLPLGYDWWMPKDWTPGKMFHGKFGVPLPAHLPPGTYDVAFVLLDEDGTVLPLTDPTPGRDGAEEERTALLARGEARYDGALTIVTPEARADRAKSLRLEAIERADEGKCQEARDAWWSSRRLRPLDDRYMSEHTPTVHRHLAACYVGLVSTTDDLEEQLEYLERARYYDPRNPEVYRVGAEVAAPLAAEGLARYREGLAACDGVAPAAQGFLARFFATSEDYRALGDCYAEQQEHWDVAYQRLSRAMRADPTDSWSRRYAEEVRALRLGIDAVSQARHEAERAERKRKADKRKEEYEERKKERAQDAKRRAREQDDDAPDGKERDEDGGDEAGGDEE